MPCNWRSTIVQSAAKSFAGVDAGAKAPSGLRRTVICSIALAIGIRQPWRFEAVPPNPAFRMCPALYKNPFGACFVLNRVAYDDLGGFYEKTWAHDDGWSHKVWLSQKWVSVGYPGRGYMHLGAQSWHHGEAVEYIGTHEIATGMTAEESGKKQDVEINAWEPKLAHIFTSLGGTPRV